MPNIYKERKGETNGENSGFRFKKGRGKKGTKRKTEVLTDFTKGGEWKMEKERENWYVRAFTYLNFLLTKGATLC